MPNDHALAAPSPAAGPIPLNSILFDRVVRVAVGLIFLLATWVYGHNALIILRSVAADGFSLVALTRGLSVVAICAFTLTVVYLYFVRYPAVNKFAGWWACTTAVLGCFLSMGLMFFPQHTDLPIALQLISSAMILIGNGLTAYNLWFLGKSFSILPESRKLITHGPYSLVRHPLYVVEGFATIGALILFWSPWTIGLVAAQFFFQYLRLQHEERVMTETFPDYADYAKRTARLIPGVY